MTNPSDDELERGISGNETWSKVCAWAIVAGLVIETILAAVYGGHASLIENWAPVFADSLIALGVFGEIFFSGKVSESEEKLRLRSKEKVAEANLKIAELNNDTARLRNLLRDTVLATRANMTTTEVMAWVQGLVTSEKIGATGRPFLIIAKLAPFAGKQFNAIVTSRPCGRIPENIGLLIIGRR